MNYQQDSFFNIRKIVFRVLQKWYWLAASITIGLGIAFLINRYTLPVYQVSTTVYLKEPKEKLTLAGLLTESSSPDPKNLEIESIILSSYALVKKTVEDLELGVAYFKKGNVKTFELYKNSPIKLVVDSSSTFVPYNLPVTCIIKNSKTFTLKIEEDENDILFKGNDYSFGKKISLNGFTFTLLLNKPDKIVNEEIVFEIYAVNDLIAHYQRNLNILTNGEESTALTLILQGETPEKEIDFLNQHIANFMSDNVEEKNIASRRTIDFINQLLTQNTDSLEQVENKLERFKTANSTVDLSIKGTQLYGEIKELEAQKAVLITANDFFNYITASLNQNNEVDQIAIPVNLGIKDPGLESAIESMVTLQLENKLLKSEKLLKNPVIEINNRKISEIKISILEKIKSLQAANRVAINNLNKKINLFITSQQQLPSAERQYVDIKRNYAVSEALVQFLMQKQAEAGITQASNTSDYKIIDLARVEGTPIKPRPSKNYITAVIVGLIIPIAFIFIADLINNKIANKEDLQQLTSLPVLGIIISSASKKDLIADGLQKSALAESFRTVRSNLSYMAEEDGSAKILLFTSSISGEGKTFCAKNLAYILAISGKKIIFINADMRKQHDHSDLGVNGAAGLSNYLSGMVLSTDIILKTKVPDLSIIKSGNIPPNPSELLLGKRMKVLLNELKSLYDYVIVDTPPVGIVSDGLELMKEADINIYVVRQNYTIKYFLSNLNELYSHYKYKNLTILFNGVDLKKSQDGYNISSYGYGYYDEVKKNKVWWKRKSKVQTSQSL